LEREFAQKATLDSGGKKKKDKKEKREKKRRIFCFKFSFGEGKTKFAE
jgi:hypothetical protein